MKLYKPTLSFAATVAQEIRLVLPVEEGAPAGSYRRVTIHTPNSPRVALAVLPYMIRNAATGETTWVTSAPQLGLNAHYKLPQLSPDSTPHFCLLPEQSIMAAAVDKFAHLSIFCEYVQE